MSKAKFIEIVKDFDKNKVVLLISKRNYYLLTFINSYGFLGTIKTVSQKNSNNSKKQTYNNSIEFYKRIKTIANYKNIFIF